MTDITCRLTTKNRDQLRNPMLSNRVWATFLHVWPHFLGICCHPWAVINIFSKFEVFNSTRQKGNAKVEIHVVWGQLGFTHGHQQCHHSIEHAQLPPVAFQLVSVEKKAAIVVLCSVCVYVFFCYLCFGNGGRVLACGKQISCYFFLALCKYCHNNVPMLAWLWSSSLAYFVSLSSRFDCDLRSWYV